MIKFIIYLFLLMRAFLFQASGALYGIWSVGFLASIVNITIFASSGKIASQFGDLFLEIKQSYSY